MNSEPSDPVERADQRQEALGDGDITHKPDGTIEQRPHGNMDETLVPKGKDHPRGGPVHPGTRWCGPGYQPRPQQRSSQGQVRSRSLIADAELERHTDSQLIIYHGVRRREWRRVPHLFHLSAVFALPHRLPFFSARLSVASVAAQVETRHSH
jgi:hypothetical protein